MEKLIEILVSRVIVYGPLMVAVVLASVKGQRFAPWMVGMGAGLVAFLLIAFQGVLPSGRWQVLLYQIYVFSFILLIAGGIGLLVRTVRRGRKGRGSPPRP